MDILSFDIEISDIFELKNNENLDKYAPFHISVASTAADNGEEKLWYSVDENDKPLINIAQEKAVQLLEYLKAMQEKGYLVCAWNGLKFDMQWIGYNAGDMKLAAEVAFKIYDPMFQFFNQRGFPVGLASVAKAMGIEQTKLMDGADAPKEWQAGNFQKVMDYVLVDSQITNMVVNEIVKQKRISWITKKGDKRTESMSKLKTVEEVLQDPEPDQSWMDKPILREDFHEWLIV